MCTQTCTHTYIHTHTHTHIHTDTLTYKGVGVAKAKPESLFARQMRLKKEQAHTHTHTHSYTHTSHTRTHTHTHTHTGIHAHEQATGGGVSDPVTAAVSSPEVEFAPSPALALIASGKKRYQPHSSYDVCTRNITVFAVCKSISLFVQPRLRWATRPWGIHTAWS
jgi:hypothetical protein